MQAQVYFVKVATLDSGAEIVIQIRATSGKHAVTKCRKHYSLYSEHVLVGKPSANAYVTVFTK
jgi:hypothetical protein